MPLSGKQLRWAYGIAIAFALVMIGIDWYQEGPSGDFGRAIGADEKWRQYKFDQPLTSEQREQLAKGSHAYSVGDHSKAFRTLIPLANDDVVHAQFAVGTMYQEGRHVEEDFKRSCNWYKKAAEAGHRDAQSALGTCYDWGRGLEKDQELAVYWYKKAAQKGDVIAQVNLAYNYRDGDGVEQDHAEAVRWLREAARQGDPKAQYSFARMLDAGHGVERDPNEAFDLFYKAAQKGQVNAMNALSRAYQKGSGVSQNLRESYQWGLLALRYGYEKSRNVTESIGQRLSPGERRQAERWVEEWEGR